MVLNINIDFALEDATPEKLRLLQAVMDAHDMAARNNQNASSGAAVNAFFGSAQLTFRMRIVASISFMDG